MDKTPTDALEHSVLNGFDSKEVTEFAIKIANLWQSELSALGTSELFASSLQQQLKIWQANLNATFAMNGYQDGHQSTRSKTPPPSYDEFLNLFGQLAARLESIEKRLERLEKTTKP